MSQPINYISLLRYFWDEVPYLPGYKSEYGIIFFAVVDSINRNCWRETEIDFDRIINKVKCSKRMYYEGLKWLSGCHQLLTYIPGRNDYSRARFGIGEGVIAAVQKCTSNDKPAVQKRTSTFEAAVQKRTSTDTSTAPIIDKPKKPDKTGNEDSISFDVFWNSYGKKNGSKANAMNTWKTLSEMDKKAAIEAIPAYVAYQPDPTYRKDPERYLKHRIWENDFTLKKVSNLSASSSVIAPKPVIISR